LKKHIQTHNKTGIIVIHDANLAYRYCSHALMLFGQGKWASGTKESMINANSLEQLYGQPIETLSNENQTIFVPRLS